MHPLIKRLQYNAANELITDGTKSYSYDNNGNLINDGEREYVYNADNQLIQVKQGTAVVAEYEYNAQGLRTKKVSGTNTEYYYYNGGKVIYVLSRKRVDIRGIYMWVEVLVEKLNSAGKSLAVAESCTGGLVCGAITDVSGSSGCFGYGVVTYSNAAKTQLLGVPEETLNCCGAVSHQTALAMAKGVRRVAQSDLGVAITGIAGPTGGNETKPVGLVYIALNKSGLSVCEKYLLSGSRKSIREKTRELVFQLIFRYGV